MVDNRHVSSNQDSVEAINSSTVLKPSFTGDFCAEGCSSESLNSEVFNIEGFAGISIELD